MVFKIPKYCRGRCDWFLKFLNIVIKRCDWFQKALNIVISKNSMEHVLMLVGTFIDTLIRKKLLGFKLSTDQKGLMRW